MSDPGSRDTSPGQAQPGAALLGVVERELSALSRTRQLRFILLGLTGLMGAVGMALMHGFNGPAARGLGPTLLMVGYLVGALGLCALAFGLRIPTGRRLLWVAPMGALGALMLLGTSVLRTSSGGGVWAGAGCLMGGLVTAGMVLLVALGLGGGVLRRHAPTGPLLGVGVGLFGVFMLHLSCPADDALHLLLWHGLVPVVAGGLTTALWRWADR